MPERPVTIAYAAGAGLAAIALVYVFQPTFFIDGESAGTSASSRKRGIVGLSNPANDCYINSVLQALAGLGDLRIYLIRETHRRALDGPGVYGYIVEDPSRKGDPAWKIEGLQNGIATSGLKDILDALNERPIYQKTISATGFVTVLEQAYQKSILRQQQDAQEFLQKVTERLGDEYHAGQRARKNALLRLSNGNDLDQVSEKIDSEDQENKANGEKSSESQSTAKGGLVSNGTRKGMGTLQSQGKQASTVVQSEPEDGFPLEGATAQQIECLTCKYQPMANESTFCTIQLTVPRVSSTTLNDCFTDMFRTEHIEDFKCEKCRLVHAIESFKQDYHRSKSEKDKAKIKVAIEKVEHAIETDPEQEPKDVTLPDKKFAPKGKIAKHVKITKFPKVLAIHLSRSIYEGYSMKNSAKVAFPERLRLGGLLNQRMYRLVSVVCHKGSHDSGHYESFRRQYLHPPFSTPTTFHTAGAYSKTSTPISTPTTVPLVRPDEETSTISSTPELLSPDPKSSTTSLPFPHLENSANSPSTTNKPRDAETSSIRSLAHSAKSTLSKVPSIHQSSPTPSTTQKRSSTSSLKNARSSISELVRGGGKKKSKQKATNRWWRISDDQIKECKTGDVLGMQKEVYLLFYEMEKVDV
ncbi:hypothetical protein HYALB_00003186 [Hymenoscyphus albidus]|uniref:Ubiquitin carboxyl-terminal hydrolase n=1 Tax=Hymenoscyphus albidus TaxID=595503 RepID=A0A9N9LDG0_9HELO|nr:hypothetical protein HYALB_00003186 [Hymenoscyphus albidus]